MSFNSPNENAYKEVVEAMRLQYPDRSSQLVMTSSNYNHKFHGRFLLAYMAKTKYVLVVDDDRNIDSTTVYDYIQYMNLQKGVWGNFGHLRASTFDGYKSWPNVGYNLNSVDWVEQDYLCGMWFLEQTWLEYFMKERPPSWATAEDMHLSHVMRKYLNVNTYGGKVALNPKGLPGKDYAATVGSALDLREYIFDHQLGRGNKVANVDQPLDTLVYAESAGDIEDFIEKMDACPAEGTKGWRHGAALARRLLYSAEQRTRTLTASSWQRSDCATEPTASTTAPSPTSSTPSITLTCAKVTAKHTRTWRFRSKPARRTSSCLWLGSSTMCYPTHCSCPVRRRRRH